MDVLQSGVWRSPKVLEQVPGGAQQREQRFNVFITHSKLSSVQSQCVNVNDNCHGQCRNFSLYASGWFVKMFAHSWFTLSSNTIQVYGSYMELSPCLPVSSNSSTSDSFGRRLLWGEEKCWNTVYLLNDNCSFLQIVCYFSSFVIAKILEHTDY